MKLTTVLFLFPLSIYAIEWKKTNKTSLIDKHLYDGREINIHSAPYMALVYADRSYPDLPFCGAAIITTRHLISTAYFFSKHQHKNFKVITGYTFAYPIEYQKYHEIKKVYIHEQYDPNEIYNDIALIELKELLRLSKSVKLIKLATPKEKILYPVTMRITGFGQQSDGTVGRLVEKEVEILNPATVNFTQRLIVLNKVSLSNCFGDSGNPGIVNETLTTLSIFESGCELTDFPKFFTGVPYYYEWIKRYVGSERLEKYPDLN